MKRKTLVPFLLSVLISVLLLAWLSQRIEGDQLAGTLAALHIPALLVFMGISLAGTLLRAWRYKLLLAPEPVGWGSILGVTFIRNLFVDLLPARIGSLSYVYVLNRRLGFPLASAASTFMLAVLLDFLTLSPFLVVSLLWVGLGTSMFSAGWILAFSLGFLVVLFCILWQIVPLTRLITRWLLKILKAVGWEERKQAHQLKILGEQTAAALARFQRRRIFWPIYGISLLIRLAKYASLFALLFALLFSHGFTLRTLSFGKTILGITAAEFTSVLPVKGLAGFGTWESAWSLAFQLMDFDPGLAVLSGIGVHLITNCFEYLLGILAILVIFSPLVRPHRIPASVGENHTHFEAQS
jgi:hypothetical protein